MSAVRDVYNPADKNPESPVVKLPETVEGSAKYYEEKTRAAVAKKEFEQTLSPPAPAEPPFKVQGSVNLGTIDFQKQQEKLEQAIAGIQKEHEDQINQLKKDAEGYRDQVHDIQFKMMQQMMETRMESLKESLDKSLVKPETKSFADQITEINSLAGALGYQKLSPDSGTPATLKLEMMRLDMDEKARERDFQRQTKIDERMWLLKLEEIKSTNLANTAKIQAEREKTNMLAAAPEVVGRAIGKAMLEGSRQEETSPPSPKQKRSSYHIEAGDGDSGETACPTPGCGGTIAISPTARTAVCPGCNMRIPIHRQNRRGDEVEEAEE